MLPATITCFFAACLLSMLLTVLVRGIALRVGLTDQPDGRRKLHRQPIPLGGGVAVFLATAGVLGAILLLPNPWNLVLREDWRNVLGFFLSCVSVLLLGLIDDRVGLRGRHKLLGQVVAASVLIASGIMIRRLGLFGWTIDLGYLAYPVTLFWLVGAINSINLLDGIDGLATTLGILLTLTLAALAFMTGHASVAIVALVFAGSLVGFLRFNFPPASIFLGDAGSMLIGLMVGALAIHASLKGPGTVLLAAPLATLTLPIFDSVAAIIRRKLTGRSVYCTDRCHFHHRLLDALGTNRRVLAVASLACGLTSTGALVSVATKSDLVAMLVAVGVVAIFAATGLFGRGEMLLLASRLHLAASTLSYRLVPRRQKAIQTAIRVQGHQQWDVLWENLTQEATRLGLGRLHLDINLPRIHESYTATWDRPCRGDHEERWAIDFPLVISGSHAGRLTIGGHTNGATARQQIEQILELFDPLETRLQALATAEPPKPPHLVAVGAANGNGKPKTLHAAPLAYKHPK